MGRDVAVLKLPLELYTSDLPLYLPYSTCLDSIKGRDRERDVAVLKLDLPADKLANLKPVRIGSSSNLLVGQKVRGDTGRGRRRGARRCRRRRQGRGHSRKVVRRPGRVRQNMAGRRERVRQNVGRR